MESLINSEIKNLWITKKTAWWNFNFGIQKFDHFMVVIKKIGNRHNENFFGIFELNLHYDLILKEHLEIIKYSQISGKQLQVHHLSWQTQN